MFAKLICQGCGADLSGAIEIRCAADLPPVWNDGTPPTPAGIAIRSMEPIEWSLDPSQPAKLEFTPQFWMNPRDMEHAVEAVSDPRRLNGCCGLDGCDGPNMKCQNCETEVGTRRSDCWTADVFIPEPGNTNWIEYKP